MSNFVISILFGTVLFFSFGRSAAQNSSLTPIVKMNNKLKTLKSVSFEEKTLEKSFFNQDTILSNKHNTLFFDDNGDIASSDLLIDMESYKGRKVFNKKKEYFLELDSTYTERVTDHPNESFGHLFGNAGLIANFSTSLKSSPQQIRRLEDTLINNKKCYYFENLSFDTVINGERNFTYEYLVVDKENFLPIASKYEGYGVLLKEDKTIGSFRLYSESSYSHFKFNIGKNYLMDFAVPSGYTPPKQLPLLEIGASAPNWAGFSTEDLEYSMSYLRGRNVLLFLSDINCPGSQLSINMMNHLTTLYKDQNVVFLGIYSDPKKSVERYIMSNKISFPIVYDAQAIKNKFNAPGAPYFYVLNDKGKIVARRLGYSDDLERILINSLDKLLQH